MTERPELISALLNAKGADYRLDAAIAIYRRGAVEYPSVPPYTSSIDAALKLVPDMLIWGIATHRPDEIFNPGGAQAFVTDGDADGIYAHADAPTAPLALCIAALRADGECGADLSGGDPSGPKGPGAPPGHTPIG